MFLTNRFSFQHGLLTLNKTPVYLFFFFVLFINFHVDGRVNYCKNSHTSFKPFVNRNLRRKGNLNIEQKKIDLVIKTVYVCDIFQIASK